MGFECDLGWEYFGPDPMTSPRMMEHMDWHNAPENKARTGNYGERFLVFHQQFIGKFDLFRATKGLLPVTGWDPSTPIPAALSHDHVLTAPRATDNPFLVDPHCKTPTWATVTGGIDVEPLYGYTNLCQFKSLDELGRAIDNGWHGTVHNTIGGDMSQFHSPIDPVFWRWHKWIDNVRAAWAACWSRFVRFNEALVLRILFGGVNDAPGLGLTPGGTPVPIPGGPGDPVWTLLSPAARNVAAGLVLQQVASMVSDEAVKAQIEKLSAGLSSTQIRSLFR
jgi:hypothetical protein